MSTLLVPMSENNRLITAVIQAFYLDKNISLQRNNVRYRYIPGRNGTIYGLELFGIGSNGLNSKVRTYLTFHEGLFKEVIIPYAQEDTKQSDGTSKDPSYIAFAKFPKSRFPTFAKFNRVPTIREVGGEEGTFDSDQTTFDSETITMDTL